MSYKCAKNLAVKDQSALCLWRPYFTKKEKFHVAHMTWMIFFDIIFSVSRTVGPGHKKPDVSFSTFTNATRPGLNGKDPERMLRMLYIAGILVAEVGRHFGVHGRQFNVSQEDFDRQVRLPTVPEAANHVSPCTSALDRHIMTMRLLDRSSVPCVTAAETVGRN